MFNSAITLGVDAFGLTISHFYDFSSLLSLSRNASERQVILFCNKQPLFLSCSLL